MRENTDKQTQYKSEKVGNLRYSKTKLPWFSCVLQHSARKRGGLILQRPRAHTRRQPSSSHGPLHRAPHVLYTRSPCTSRVSVEPLDDSFVRFILCVLRTSRFSAHIAHIPGRYERFSYKLILGWWRGTVVERRSLAGELSLSCA